MADDLPLTSGEICWHSAPVERKPIKRLVDRAMCAVYECRDPEAVDVIHLLACALLDYEAEWRAALTLAQIACSQLYDAGHDRATKRESHVRAAEEHRRLRAAVMMHAIVADQVDGEDVVMLRGGLSVPLVALKLAWKLESLGVGLRVEGGDLYAKPASLVPKGDIPALRAHREALKAIVRYCAEERPA